MHSKKKKKNGCFQIFRLSNNRTQDSSDPGPDFISLGTRKLSQPYAVNSAGAT